MNGNAAEIFDHDLVEDDSNDHGYDDARGRRYLTPDSVVITTTGSAGQRYGAFCNDGMTLTHTGTCNDGGAAFGCWYASEAEEFTQMRRGDTMLFDGMIGDWLTPNVFQPSSSGNTPLLSLR